MAKLLIVDDEEKIREVVREYAEFDGYEVTEAAQHFLDLIANGADKYNTKK